MSISRKRTYVASVGAVLSLGLVVAGCGDDGGSAGPTTGAATGATTGATGGTSASVPQVGATDFTSDFSQMKELTDLASQGKGLIGVLLPDTTTSTRYVQYDAPYLKQAFEAAGLQRRPVQDRQRAGQRVDDADAGRGRHQRRRLRAAGRRRSTRAAVPRSRRRPRPQGVKVIDYDRLVTGGPADRYYVSFDNVKVGKLIGQGDGRLHHRLEGRQARTSWS